MSILSHKCKATVEMDPGAVKGIAADCPHCGAKIFKLQPDSTPCGTPSSLLVSRDYEDKPSAPAWGVNLSAKNLPELEQFRFDEQVAQLIPEA